MSVAVDESNRSTGAFHVLVTEMTRAVRGWEPSSGGFNVAAELYMFLHEFFAVWRQRQAGARRLAISRETARLVLRIVSALLDGVAADDKEAAAVFEEALRTALVNGGAMCTSASEGAAERGISADAFDALVSVCANADAAQHRPQAHIPLALFASLCCALVPCRTLWADLIQDVVLRSCASQVLVAAILTEWSRLDAHNSVALREAASVVRQCEPVQDAEGGENEAWQRVYRFSGGVEAHSLAAHILQHVPLLADARVGALGPVVHHRRIASRSSSHSQEPPASAPRTQVNAQRTQLLHRLIKHRKHNVVCAGAPVV